MPLILLAALLFGCAVAEVAPNLTFSNISSQERPAKVIGFYSTITEGSLIRRNIGVQIKSVDGVPIEPWAGAVVNPGKRAIVVRFFAYPHFTKDTIIETDLQAGHSYIVRTYVNVIKDASAPFWIEDLNDRRVVAGSIPPEAAEFSKSAAFEHLRNQFQAFANSNP